MRCFFGMPLPIEVKQSLGKAAINWDTFRLVNPNNFHITLVFLGEIEVGVLPKLQEIGYVIASKHSEFTMELDNVITKRDMLWAVPRTNLPYLDALQKDLEDMLVKENLCRPFFKNFHPHVKLAFTDSMGRQPLPQGVVFEVNSFGLYSTEFLKSGGVKYNSIADFKLQNI